MKATQVFVLFCCFLLYAPVSVLAEATKQIFLNPGNDSIVPFTASFNNAFLNTSITWDANTKDNLPGPEIQSLNSTFDFSQTDWLGIAIDNFEMNFDVAFGLLASGSHTNNFTYPIDEMELGQIGFSIGIIGVTFSLKLNLELYAQITSPLETKFSTGINAKLVNPAGFIMGLDIDATEGKIELEEFMAPFKFNVTPLFNTSDPAPEFDFEVAFHMLEIDLDLPTYKIAAHQLANVDYQCNGITEQTPKSQHYSNLTHITEEVTMDVSRKRGKVFGGSNSTELMFGPVDLYNVTSSCLAFSPILQTQIQAPMLVSDLSSTQALNAVARPTKHLSNGGAVGITFTVEIFLLAIVAGIFWIISSRRARQDGSSGQHVRKRAVMEFFIGIWLVIVGLFPRKRVKEEDHDNNSAPAWQPEPTSEKNWTYNGPIDAVTPVYRLGETPQYTTPTQNHVSVTEDLQFRQPQRYPEIIPVPTSYQSSDNIPWEEPRSNRTPQSPKGIFRKKVPGES